MHIQLAVRFEPLTEEWKSHCHTVLMALENLSPSAQRKCGLTIDPQGNACLTVRDMEPAWFRVTNLGEDEFEAMMAGWSTRLGTSSAFTFYPKSSFSRGPDGFVRYFLHACISVEDQNMGLYRACLRILEHPDRLPADVIQYLLQLGTALENQDV